MEKKEAIRLFPKKAFGSYPDIDGFITQGVPVEGQRQTDSDRRWLVDQKPFPNLTKAREYVRDVLQIPENAEMGTEITYQPATGWKTKTRGTKMSNVPQTLEMAKAKLADAQEQLQALEKLDSTTMDALTLAMHKSLLQKAKEKLAYQTRCVPAAAAGLTLKVYEAQKKAEQKASDKAIIKAHNQSKTPHLDAANEALAEKRALIPTPDQMRRNHQAAMQQKENTVFDVQIESAGGGKINIKCQDDKALDSVFAMIKKHNI